MTKLIPRLVRDFDLQLAEPNDPWHVENYWFVRPKEFKVIVRRRTQDA